jgi:uncharacterized glyoxalase superfamily protein PhnB
MRPNRSVLVASVIPELAYPEVAEATEWLCRAFGFAERLRIGNHRAQLILGNGAIVVTARDTAPAASDADSHGMLVRVDDVDGHFERSKQFGAHIVRPPADHPFGERQYTVEDPGGHRWTFSQTIADVDPASWGGTPVNID